MRVQCQPQSPHGFLLMTSSEADTWNTSYTALHGPLSPSGVGDSAQRVTKNLIFCHNDLSTHNIIVDPDTLEVKAIMDWNGPASFSMSLKASSFTIRGPLLALNGEVNDDK